MNGVFTDRDALFLLPDEYEHYLSLGLAPPLQSESFGLVLEGLQARIAELIEEKAEYKDHVISLESEVDGLREELEFYKARLKRYETLSAK